MSDHALLHYAMPPRTAVQRRANGLAIFAFIWAFAVSPPAVLLFFRVREWAAGALPHAAFSALAVAALALTPAIAVISGYVATERGAAWDSPYRWTALAIVAVPLASIMTSAGMMYWLRELL